MIGRVVEIREDGRYLSLHRGFLIVSEKNEEIARIPLDEVAVLMVSAHQLIYSHALLIELNERGIAFIACGKNHLPAAIFWPVSGHYRLSGIMNAQIRATQLIRKQLWKKVIQSKICFQQEVLEKVGIKETALVEISKKVRSGDTTNREAQAARRYWPLLFGKNFTRDIDSDGVNACLNYGYAIIRSAMARAIMASGLYPALGIFHKNQMNPMCLVDDLMEPYRPVIDWEVYRLKQEGKTEVNKEVKRRLALILNEGCTFSGNSTPISVAMYRTAQSLSQCFQELTYKKLQFPDRLFSLPDKKELH